MSLNTLYGVNGVGKDTVAAEIKANRAQDVVITSASRLSMYLLGITDNFDAQRSISRDHYKKLESVPQTEMVELEEGPYKEFVTELANGGDRVMMLSHLVFALHLDKEVVYLADRHVPDWYISENDSLIQLTSTPEEILARRRIDALTGSRDRPALLSQIMAHQALCNTEWNRIKNGQTLPKKGMHTVENTSLPDTCLEVGDILYG